MMALVIGAALLKTEEGVQRCFSLGQSQRLNRSRLKCESRADLKSRGLPKYAGALPIHGEAHVPRDAIPDPEKQRLSPAASQQIAGHPYRSVIEALN
jgi:hypothetical protein